MSPLHTTQTSSSRCSVLHRCDWDLHGVVLQVRSEVELPPALLQPLQRHRRLQQAWDPEAVVRLMIKGGMFPDDRCFAGTAVRFARATPIRGVFAEPRYYLRIAEGGVVGDLMERSIEFHAPEALWLQNADVVRTLFPVSLVLQLARHGLFYVHAAVVVDPEDQTWMLVGGGGAGKSTTAYALVRAGWRYLSDDGALLRLRGDRVEAVSFMDEFHLDRSLQSAFVELEWQEAVRQHPHKGVVAMERIFPGKRVERATPVRLIELCHGDAPAAGRERGGRASLLRSLVADNPFIFVNQPHGHLDVLARLVSQCQTARVALRSQLLWQPVDVLQSALASDALRSRPRPGTIQS